MSEDPGYTDRMVANLPATVHADPLQVGLLEVDDLDLVVTQVQPVGIPRMGGDFQVWVRETEMGDMGATDFLLVGAGETRTADELSEALSADATEVWAPWPVPRIHAGPRLPEAGTKLDELYGAPCVPHDGGFHFGDPDLVQDAAWAGDGRSLLIGEWPSADGRAEPGPWVRRP